jgi:hypothetical protein
LRRPLAERTEVALGRAGDALALALFTVLLSRTTVYQDKVRRGGEKSYDDGHVASE